jgi:hypothetical protein
MMMKNKIFASLVVFVCIFLLSPPETDAAVRFQFFGTLAAVQEMGSTSDYVAGENDFPVTPAHLEYGPGLGAILNIAPQLDFQLTSEYLFGADVEKTDPTDGETYTYRTYDNINFLGSLMLKFGGNPRFFVTAGGGLNILKPYDDKQDIGSLGSIILIEAPDKKTNPMVVFGGGVLLNMLSGTFKFEALYSIVFDYDKKAFLFRIGYVF